MFPLRPAAPAPVQPTFGNCKSPAVSNYGPHHLSPKMYTPVVSTAKGPLICSQLLSMGGASILKVYFQVCKGSCPYNSKAPKHLPTRSEGSTLMESVPIRTQLYLEPRAQCLMGNTGEKRKAVWLGVSLAPAIFTYSFSKTVCTVNWNLGYGPWMPTGVMYNQTLLTPISD